MWYSDRPLFNAHTHTQVAADMLQVCKFTHLELGEPVPCHELDQDRDGPGNMFIDNCVATVLKVRGEMWAVGV